MKSDAAQKAARKTHAQESLGKPSSKQILVDDSEVSVPTTLVQAFRLTTLGYKQRQEIDSFRGRDTKLSHAQSQKVKPNKGTQNKRKPANNTIAAIVSNSSKLRKQHYDDSASSSRSNSAGPARYGQQTKQYGPEEDSEMDEALEHDEDYLESWLKPQTGMQASLVPADFGPITASETTRTAFLRHLRQIPGPAVTLVNTVDNSSPPLGYRFIETCKLGAGVTIADDGFMAGCECKPNNGRNVGCEYTKCECLREAELGPNGKPHFPYYCTGPRNGCLRDFYLESRNAIFECNKLCRCRDNCKNRNVQHGRKVMLEIFKTANRGWGLRCPQFLRKGQFIDTYRGEIITSAEADKREENNKGKDSYLYTMDKFAAGYGIPDEDLYVVDGEHMGGPTRFMNHSCEPNCRQFTVSYNNGDPKVYDLAFFAKHDIPANTELTFDYKDTEEVEATEERRPEEGMEECLCGAAKCRKYLWA